MLSDSGVIEAEKVSHQPSNSIYLVTFETRHLGIWYLIYHATCLANLFRERLAHARACIAARLRTCASPPRLLNTPLLRRAPCDHN